MRREVMETIAGIEIFPVIAFIIFGVFFLVMLWWVFKLDKSYISKASTMPLDEEMTLSKTNTLIKENVNHGS